MDSSSIFPLLFGLLFLRDPFGFSTVMNATDVGLLARTCRQLAIVLSNSWLVRMETWIGNQ